MAVSRQRHVHCDWGALFLPVEQNERAQAIGALVESQQRFRLAVGVITDNVGEIPQKADTLTFAIPPMPPSDRASSISIYKNFEDNPGLSRTRIIGQA